ncbi:MAG: LamG domain-containing protein, partial [Akkermansiaceae bacterium]|nr:LamG domain-containing protein [Akkermansiaceae bacterium]
YRTFTGIIDGGGSTLSIDGGEVVRGFISDRPESSLPVFTVGSRFNPTQQNWKGDLVELIIYLRALPRSEIAGVQRYLDKKYFEAPPLELTDVRG